MAVIDPSKVSDAILQGVQKHWIERADTSGAHCISKWVSEKYIISAFTLFSAKIFINCTVSHFVDNPRLPLYVSPKFHINQRTRSDRKPHCSVHSSTSFWSMRLSMNAYLWEHLVFSLGSILLLCLLNWSFGEYLSISRHVTLNFNTFGVRYCC